MKIRQLKVDRMPGFTRHGFHLGDIEEGMNVIWGPNGSGKTTACLAIRRLLWPNHSTVRDLGSIDLSSIWFFNNQELEIATQGNEYRLGADISKAEIQKFPPHIYTISIDDLFQATDEEFARAIAREIHGGYDLQTLHGAFVLPPRLGEREHKECQKQQEELAAEIRRQLAVYDKERRLSALEDKILAAEAAGTRLALVQAALAVKDRQKEYDEIVKKISSFPKGVEHIRAEDWKRLEDLLESRREQRKALDLLPEHHNLDIDANLCQELIQEIKQLDIKIEYHNQARIEAHEQRVFYCHELTIQPENLQSFHLAGIDRILPSLKKLHEYGLRQKEIETKLSLLEIHECENDSPVHIKGFHEAIAYLATWLNAKERTRSRPIIGSLLCLLGAIAIAFAFAPLSVAIGVVALASMAILYIALRSERKRIASRYISLGFPVPRAWSEQEVHAHIQTMEEERMVSLLNQKKYIDRAELLQRLKIEEREAAEEQEKNSPWLLETGIESLPDLPLLGSFLQLLRSAQESWLKEKKNEALLVPLNRQKEEISSTIAGMFQKSFANVIEMDNALVILRRHQQEKVQRSNLLRDLANLEAQFTELLTRCGCTNETQFFERYTLLNPYLQAVLVRDKLEGNLAELKRPLANAAELVAEETEYLERKREELEMQGASFRFLIEEKTSIESDIAKAQMGRGLEEKRRACQSADDQLEAKKSEFREKTLGFFLLNEIEESFKKEMRPEALKNADAFFQRFTNSAYAIYGLDDQANGTSFIAHDCKQSTTKKIHELSRGTRLQLLLAVRLGFIRALEKDNVMLPLILDEAVAHSDDERWHAIASVLTQEVKAGRQILYFTCQRVVKEAWVRISSEHSLPVAFHDLAKNHERLPYIAPIPYFEWPPPFENESLSDYAMRIELPGLDFSLPVSAQHIAHFLVTSRQLHGLLQVGITTFAQVQKMHEAGSLQPFLDAQYVAIALAKGALLDKFLTSYHVGRPNPIERNDLEDAMHEGCLSETFFGPLCELVSEYRGRGNQIIEALYANRIKRFRKEKIEEMRTFFLLRSKLDTRPSYDHQELRNFFWGAYVFQAESLPKDEAARFLSYLLQLIPE